MPETRHEVSPFHEETRPPEIRPVPHDRLSAEISTALSSEYRDRYGIEIPECGDPTLAFAKSRARHSSSCSTPPPTNRHQPCSDEPARTRIDRAVESQVDRREYSLQLSREGRALYQA